TVDGRLPIDLTVTADAHERRAGAAVVRLPDEKPGHVVVAIPEDIDHQEPDRECGQGNRASAAGLAISLIVEDRGLQRAVDGPNDQRVRSVAAHRNTVAVRLEYRRGMVWPFDDGQFAGRCVGIEEERGGLAPPHETDNVAVADSRNVIVDGL